jgi:hypothetical protein
MTEPADIVTCQSCGAGSTEPEAHKHGWVASEGRWACNNCLSTEIRDRNGTGCRRPVRLPHGQLVRCGNDVSPSSDTGSRED